MKFMLTLFGEEGGMDDATPEQMKAVMDGWAAFGNEVMEAGAYLAGEGLQDSSTARTVRVQEDGERIVADGPFAETKEQIGGFYLLECKDIDEALEWARKVPVQGGAIEVKPVMDYEAAGYQDPRDAKAAS